MKDLLNEKLKAYRSLGPVLPEARKWLEDSNLWMLLYTVLCQRGVRIEKKREKDARGHSRRAHHGGRAHRSVRLLFPSARRV